MYFFQQFLFYVTLIFHKDVKFWAEEQFKDVI